MLHIEKPKVQSEEKEVDAVSGGSSSGSDVESDDDDRLAQFQKMPQYQKEAENQAGATTNLLDSHFKKIGKDQRIVLQPDSTDHSGLIGLIIMKFDKIDESGQK